MRNFNQEHYLLPWSLWQNYFYIGAQGLANCRHVTWEDWGMYLCINQWNTLWHKLMNYSFRIQSSFAILAFVETYHMASCNEMSSMFVGKMEFDIIAKLPIEIAQKIFRLLDINSIINAAKVSKHWELICKSDYLLRLQVTMYFRRENRKFGHMLNLSNSVFPAKSNLFADSTIYQNVSEVHVKPMQNSRIENLLDMRSRFISSSTSPIHTTRLSSNFIGNIKTNAKLPRKVSRNLESKRNSKTNSKTSHFISGSRPASLSFHVFNE